MKLNTKQLTALSMLAAISIVLVYLIRFPIFPVAPFLEYDPADIPIFIGTLLFGPLSGILLTVVVSVVQGFTVSGASSVIGVMMHIFATGSFVLVAGLMFKRNKSKKCVIMAMVCGVLAMTIAMVIWNLVFTPIFLNTPIQAVLDLMLPAIIPFNLLKGGVNALIAFLLYGAISKVIGGKQ